MGNSNFFHPPDGEEDKHAYHTKLEKKFESFYSSLQEFAQKQITGSILLLLFTIIALVWASIPAISNSYEKFVNAYFGFQFEGWIVKKTLNFWISDVLLTLFFFMIGLEIKRELLVGELIDRKQALFVIISAIGGMLVPALIFIAFNFQLNTIKGWGIPMATDTAFALGVIFCFRNRIPKSLIIFIMSLAIIDDIGAIIVVAIFYTPEIHLIYLFVTFSLIFLLIIFNYAGIRNLLPYFLVGSLIWIFIELAGIHGTIAGVIVAFTIPARPAKGPKHFIKRTKKILNYFEKRKEKIPKILADKKQHKAVEELKSIAKDVTTPLQRWEGLMELPVSIIILPIFALVNAGVPINFSVLNNAFHHPVSLGIILGLVIGKPLGISLFSGLALLTRFGNLPKKSTFLQVIAVSFLAGIGFTISLFIANLAFRVETNTMMMAKMGILCGSLLSAIFGAILILFAKK